MSLQFRKGKLRVSYKGLSIILKHTTLFLDSRSVEGKCLFRGESVVTEVMVTVAPTIYWSITICQALLGVYMY